MIFILRCESKVFPLQQSQIITRIREIKPPRSYSSASDLDQSLMSLLSLDHSEIDRRDV